MFPSGKGWFGRESLTHHQTRQIFAELYLEVLFYKDIVGKVTDRLTAYKEKLNFEID